MLRTALKPRSLGLLVVVLLVIVAFIQLGRWQLGVAEGKAHAEAIAAARAAAPVELSSVLAPHVHFPGELSSRPVTVDGAYAGDGQVLVPDRRLDGVTGYWVITPFVVKESEARLPVLRGFVTDPTKAGEAATTPTTLRGGLAPPESAVSGAFPEGQIGSVDTSILVNQWPGDLYNAFLFLEDESPAAGEPLTRVPTPLGATGVQWRNAAYAIQWWFFAAFALWMWVRMVKDDHDKGENGGRESDEPAPAADR